MRVTNEYWGQLGLSLEGDPLGGLHETYLQMFPLRGRDARHVPTDSHPSLLERLNKTLNFQNVIHAFACNNMAVPNQPSLMV